MARRVVIHRDEWGVPHIYGPSDASVVFGLAYAQAEDNFWQLEDDLIRALGRGAEVYGEEALADDIVKAAFRVERLSREEYARESSEMRRIWDAFAHGLNYFLEKHPNVRPRLLTRFEPWHTFALFRTVSARTVVDGVRLANVLAIPVAGPSQSGAAGELDPHAAASSDWRDASATERHGVAESQDTHEADGSNAWAVAPSRTAAGQALLFLNPHVSFFGSGQRYELHLQSEAGWHFSGFAILGTPVPRAGHNEHLGWTHTNTAADAGDVYRVTFDDPADPMVYKHGEERRLAIEWEDTILVRTDTGMEARRFRFWRTHHGPLVVGADGERLAVRLARFEEGGSLQQWYAMGRAGSLEQFRAALARTALPISNTMYADREGNILFVQGNAVPRRSAGHDWTRPVDGNDPSTEWEDYHAIEELPQLLNPPSGWLQNTNATPFLATAQGHNLQKENYPAYMAPEPDNPRARVSRRILEGERQWTFDSWVRAAFDTRMIEAEEHVPALVDEWERFGAVEPDRAAALDSAMHDLREWDRIATVESTATTLFVLWLERYRSPSADTVAFARMRSLEFVVDSLERRWGSARVGWGEVNRLQRIHTSGNAAFNDYRPSLPVPGAPGWTGIVFNFYTRPGPDGKRAYGTRGHTWVSAVEFGPRPRARSVVPFGQTADPTSPHWFDQAPLYAAGRMKEAWFWREDVEANARRTYRPGRPPAAAPQSQR